MIETKQKNPQFCYLSRTFCLWDYSVFFFNLLIRFSWPSCLLMKLSQEFLLLIMSIHRPVSSAMFVQPLTGMYCELRMVKWSGFKTVLKTVPSLNSYHNMDYIYNPFPSTMTVWLSSCRWGKVNHSQGAGIGRQRGIPLTSCMGLCTIAFK